MKSLKIIAGLIMCSQWVMAQYAPQAGLMGSTAVHKSAATIVGWADSAVVQRGWLDIADTSLGVVNSGADSMATGAADGQVVSLGDGGAATLMFKAPIKNGVGYDFAVFENGFTNPSNTAEAFLELATVAVSSDGVNFFTFPAHALTQTDSQIAGSGMYMQAKLLNNLAGKYVGSYGTPFDLEELKLQPGLDIQHITHVRIMDVIGSIKHPNSARDSAKNVINDPYPTPWPTGGFDLDAVAVLNSGPAYIPNYPDEFSLQVSPNPAQDYITIEGPFHEGNLILTDLTGRVILQTSIKLNRRLFIGHLASGAYHLILNQSNHPVWQGKLLKY